MFQELLNEQKEQLDYFFQSIDITKANEVLAEMLQCQGTIVFSGVGKSGIIAEKIAKTMASVGTKAIAISPVDALHGDIGLLDHHDLFVGLSKSGHTKELFELFQMVKMRGLKTIGWFCNSDAKLASICDVVMQLPIEKELCPFDLAPTTSTAVQLIFGDLLAISMMKEKQFSLSQYALNHPAGTIGKKSTLMVSDVMRKGEELPTCTVDQTLSDVLVELTNKRLGCVLVVDQLGHVQGIFTDGDLRRAIQKHSQAAFNMRMDQLMIQSFMHIDEDALADDAVSVMQLDPKKRVMMLPVLRKGLLVGLVTMHDVVNAL